MLVVTAYRTTCSVNHDAYPSRSDVDGHIGYCPPFGSFAISLWKLILRAPTTLSAAQYRPYRQ